MRTLNGFGLDAEGRFDEDTAPVYEPVLGIRHFGGDRSIRWEKLDLPRTVAEGLRDRLRTELARLEEALGD